jgi:hypothetical protein
VSNHKQITNSNYQMFKTNRFGNCNFGHWCLFVICGLVLVILKSATGVSHLYSFIGQRAEGE